MDGGGGSRARYIDSHLETQIFTQKNISDWDIVMDGGGSEALCFYTHLLKTTYLPKLTQKDISWELSWTVVEVKLSVSIFTYKKPHTYLKEHFRLAYSHGRWWE